MRKTEQLSKIWEQGFGVEYTKRKLQVHDTEGNVEKRFGMNWSTTWCQMLNPIWKQAAMLV